MSNTKSMPVKRCLISDPSELPDDYSTTPGGTLFGTTPGGTRIIYDRSFILNCRNSPLSQTPPTNIANIPGVTCPPAVNGTAANNSTPLTNGTPSICHQNSPRSTGVSRISNEDPQFNMDM